MNIRCTWQTALTLKEVGGSRHPWGSLLLRPALHLPSVRTCRRSPGWAGQRIIQFTWGSGESNHTFSTFQSTFQHSLFHVSSTWSTGDTHLESNPNGMDGVFGSFWKKMPLTSYISTMLNDLRQGVIPFRKNGGIYGISILLRVYNRNLRRSRAGFPSPRQVRRANGEEEDLHPDRAAQGPQEVTMSSSTTHPNNQNSIHWSVKLPYDSHFFPYDCCLTPPASWRSNSFDPKHRSWGRSRMN